MINVQNMTVLICDDMSNIRKAIKSSLHVLGYGKEFLQAENGKAALELLHKEQIDLVILDCNMPIMTGTEALANIRSDRNLRDLPVIMVTAEANKDIVAQAGESEIDAYLLKPITVKALSEKVDLVIGQVNNPTEMTIHLKNAKELEDKGDLDGAIDETKAAIEANPKSSRPVRDMGHLYFKKGDLDEAEQWFTKAAAMNYLDVMALHYLGEICLRKDQIEKAVQYLDNAMRISPHHLERCLNFGKALIKKGLTDRAAKVFKKAFEVAKNDRQLMEQIAEFSIAEGARDFAADLLETMVNQNPETRLLIKLGQVLIEIGAFKKAANFLMLAEQKEKDNIELKLLLAKAFVSLEHPIRAEGYLKQVLKIDPDNAQAKELFKSC